MVTNQSNEGSGLGGWRLVLLLLPLLLGACALPEEEAALVEAAPAEVAAAETVEAATTTETTTETTTAGPTVFGVGDRAVIGSFEVQVHEYLAEVSLGPDELPPEDGNRFVEFDVEVWNVTDQEQIVSSILCFTLVGEDNRPLNEAFVLQPTTGATLDGAVPVGAALRGAIVYEVPAEMTTFRLDFDCDLIGTGAASYEVGG